MSSQAQKHRHSNQHLKKNVRLWFGAALFLVVVAASGAIYAGSTLPSPLLTADTSGVLMTYSTAGPIDLGNPFFRNLGTNGRTCASCHQPADAWTVAPPHIQSRFLLTGGNDAIFRPVDGANCPSADVSSFSAKQSAYSLLLQKGLIRISLPFPSPADFTIVNIQDPYNCPETTSSQPAMYRRPLPSTNLGFLATIMWDGRETVNAQSITADLAQQAIDATTGHAQGSTPSAEQVAGIVSFETALYTAQSFDRKAGSLTAAGATGGPINLSGAPFHLGINDVLGQDPSG